MRIVFAGTPALAIPSLQALVAAGHHVVGVLTREDAPLGRKRILTASPVAVAAEELGIPVYKANKLERDAEQWVADRKADLGVIVAYGALLREPILSLPRHGWINLHFSDLPRYRGAAPVQRALIAGEQRLGLTVFRLTEALDAGAVLSRDSYEFSPGTSAGKALEFLGEFGTKALHEAIAKLSEDEDAGEPQIGESNYAHKLGRDDGRLDLSQSSSQVLAQWSGVTPEPGAWVMCDDAPLKIHEMHRAASEAIDSAEIQQALAHVGESGLRSVYLVSGTVLLVLNDGVLELTRVQPAGKPIMDAAAWLRGRGSEVELA